MTHQSAALRQGQVKVVRLSGSFSSIYTSEKEEAEILCNTRKKCRRESGRMKPSETASWRQDGVSACLWRKWEGWGGSWWWWRGRGCTINQEALPNVGTCKSGERRVGTRPNYSSTALYKYSRAGSTRLLLLVAKKHRENRVSPSWRKVFNNLLIVFQSCPDLKENHTSLASIK